jgi:hypothetical protein
MREVKRFIQMLTVVAMAAWSVGQARAAYVYTVLGDGGLLGGFRVTIDGVTESGILVGGIHVKGNEATTVPGYKDFITVCLDLNGRIRINTTYTFDELPFSGQSGLNPKWGQPSDGSAAYEAINNAAYLYVNNHPTTAKGWAALQLAVWKALYDTDKTGAITGTRFNVLSDPYGAWTTAQGWLAGLAGVEDYYVGYLLKPLDVNAQELLIGDGLSSLIAVPESTTVIAGALLLLPLGVSTLRFVRKSHAS